MSSDIFYFDYNATHPPFKDVIEKNYTQYLEKFYNPSGISRYSLNRQSELEDVRSYFSDVTGKDRKSFLFCSTGTESNHFLIGYTYGSGEFKNGFYVSPFEHSSVYGAFESLKIPYELIKCKSNGLLDIDYLESRMEKDPKPVFVILAGNETGIIQPYQEIGRICMSYNMPFLSDLMQAYGKIEIDYSYISGFSFSGHKIGGGLGAAICCVPGELKSEFRLFKGGNQENEMRAGTENTPAILSMRDASILHLANLQNKNQRLLEFRNKIETSLNSLGCTVIGKNLERLPSTSFVILPTDDIDFILMGLEERKIIIATGSSCKSRAREASPTLLAMGYSKEEALRAVRISTGYFTKIEEVNHLVKCMSSLINIFA